MDRKCIDFIWGSSTDQRKTPLAARNKVCLPKKFGGLNVKGCRNWNEASVWEVIMASFRKTRHSLVKMGT